MELVILKLFFSVYHKFILTKNKPSRYSQELVVIFALLMLQHVVCSLLLSAGELTKESMLEITCFSQSSVFTQHVMRC